eukprot:6958616-Pyramimonas_sp.AAC.1
MEALAFLIASSSPFMVPSPVWEGAAGIHVMRSLMGSNSSSVSSCHLEPKSSPLKRTHSLANLPYSDSSRRRAPVAVPNILPSPMMT